MPVIEAVGLRRSYRTGAGFLRRRPLVVEAVKGVSFGVARGQLYGLLGPNGAGKTTTIKMLTTLLVPSGGQARVLGYDVVADARRVRASIGSVFGGDRGLYERLSALDNLRYFAELYGVAPRAQRRRIAMVLDLVGLAGRERERVEGYSRGMRQRLHIARGLLHDPPVVFLDEPTIGVDPVGARELRATIASLTQQGKTVLLTTHYMHEADALCDRVGVIGDGRLLDEGTPRPQVSGGGPHRGRDRGVRGLGRRRRGPAPGPGGGGGLAGRARPRPGAPGPVGQRAGAHRGAAGPAGRRPGGPGGDAGADPGGRLCRPDHPRGGPMSPGGGLAGLLRLVGLGWAFHVKRLSRSGFFLLISAVEPVVYASIAFFMFRAGDRPGSLLYAAIGAGMLGVWSTTLTGSGQAITLLRQEGMLELLVAAPVPFLRVLVPITLATATVGLYSLVATLAWGRLLFGIPLGVAHPWLLLLAVPATVVALGLLGVVLASVFVLYRHANALTNLLEFPVYLATGLLVPVAAMPGWVRPLSWLLAPTWGARAIREAVLGGDPLPAIGACVLLGIAYLGVGGLALRRFELLARRRATLALT
jgi:ABC-type multidrug transport system ATPase subunit/ABC-type polysaccharide/polyol phosphate export permease